MRTPTDSRYGSDESTSKNTGKSRRPGAVFGWHRFLSIALSLAIVTSALGASIGGLAGTAAAKSAFEEDEMEFCDDPVVDRVDEDGDGYLSSFNVCINADTMIQDGTIGKRDIQKDHAWNIKEGNPKFAYFGIIEKGGKKRPVLLGIEEVESGTVAAVQMKKKIEIQGQVDKRDIYLDDHDVEEIRVMYVESDSSPNALVMKDVDTLKAIGSGVKGGAKLAAGTALIIGGAVPAGIKTIGSASGDGVAVAKSIKKSWSSDDHIDTDATLLSDSIRLEHPDNDAQEKVKVTSNADNAEVLIDGTNVGTTPLHESYPVDHSEREGKTRITVRKDGYVTESKNVRLSPPQSVDFDLKKVKQPITVTSAESGRTVKVDGSVVGTTPWSGERWVHGSYDISVENASLANGGQMDRSFAAISPPRTINASEVSTGSGGLDFGPSIPGSRLDSVYVDPLGEVPEFDFTSVLDAQFSASPGNPTAGQPVTFDASNSFAYGNLTFQWDYGDGTSEQVSAPVVEHVYDSPGTYTAQLTVSDGDGNTDTVSSTVTVESAPPNAQFVSSTLQAVTGESVTFDASAASDPDGSVVRYEWDLDGDGQMDATGQTVQRAYANAGAYDVRLTVVDDRNEADTVSQRLDVQRPNAAPQPQVNYSPGRVETGETVSFDASNSRDTDGSIRSYTWEFGDGTKATGETVTHTFSRPGSYSVRLLVVDDRGEMTTTTETVSVNAAGSGSRSTPTATADKSTPPETMTPTPVESTTPTERVPPETDTPEPPESDTPEPTDTETPETPGDEGPGFGVAVSVLALLAAALLAARRRD